MPSTPTETWSRGQVASGTSNAGRGRGSETPRGGRGGSRGRGRGRGRTPSIGGTPDSSSASLPSSPLSRDRPSLLARMDPKSPVVTSPSSPLSGRVPASPSEASTPGGPNNKPRKRKGSNATAGSPRSPITTSLPSPLGRKAAHQLPPKPSPLAAPPVIKDPPHLPLDSLPNLSIDSEASTPKIHSPTPTKEYATDSLLMPSIGAGLEPPSPIPSPRPFTPQGRDWAAEDDEDDAGSLPSLDDWGISDVKSTTSEAGDEKAGELVSASQVSVPSRKLSLTTDTASLKPSQKLSAPSSAIDSPGGFANVIPPTPVAQRPGQAQLPTGPTKLQQSHIPSKLGDDGSNSRAGKSFSRTNSPQPLNLVRARSPSPGALQSGSPRPTSGGVSLGRSSSPAPGSPGFVSLRVGSPSPGSGFASQPNSPGYRDRRSSSPGLHPHIPSGASRPSSPRPLSGGVSLGVSRPASPNPDGIARRGSSPVPPPPPQSPPSTLTANRPDRSQSTNWRSPMRQNVGLPPKPEVEVPAVTASQSLPLAARISDPRESPSNFRGGRGGTGFRGGARGGRGGMARNDGNPFAASQFSPTTARGNKTPSSPSATRPSLNLSASPRGGGGGRGGRGGHSRNGSEAESPTSATSASSTGRVGRGHARASSRPIISATALSRINASLSPSKRPASENASSDVAPVGGT